MLSLLTWLAVIIYFVACLDHEKSYLLQDGSSSITWMAVYQNSLLITTSNDIVQKDIETGLEQRTFRAHTNQIMTFLVTEDSRMITAGWDDMIIVWDLVSGSLLKKISLGSLNTNVQGIAFWNEQVITGGDDSKARRIDLTTARVTRTVGKLITFSSLIL